jgi:hypothetical protein
MDMKRFSICLVVLIVPFVTFAEKDRIEITTLDGSRVQVSREAIAQANNVIKRADEPSILEGGLQKSLIQDSEKSGIERYHLSIKGYSMPNRPESYIERHR